MVECFFSLTFEMTNPEDQIKYSKKSARNNLENAGNNSLTVENINLEEKEHCAHHFSLSINAPNTKGTQLI